MNNQTKNILVPFDFSEEAMFGLNTAKQWAQMVGAKINMVHFTLPDEGVKDQHPKYAILNLKDVERQKQLEHRANEMLMQLWQLMDTEVAPGAEGEVFVVKAGLSNAFSEFLNQTDIDIIVSGSSSSRNLIEYFTGNNSEQMIRNTDVPILIVSTDKPLAFGDILFSTDLSLAIPEKLFELGKYLQCNGARLHIMNAMTTELLTEKEIEDKISHLAHQVGISEYESHLIVAEGELEGILKSVSEIDPDLIMMKTYQRSNLASILVGSLTEKVIRETDKPVMVQQMIQS
jgi:nucleotide-binding universal stress UspA family protein